MVPMARVPLPSPAVRAVLAALFLLGIMTADAPARAALCVEGTAIGCDDHDPCTTDRCRGLQCVHEPATGAACSDGDACTTGDRCEAGRCVGMPVVCADDGFSCTDEMCVAGHCVHVPIDARCVPAETCESAVCAPHAPGHDAAGCINGPPRGDGQACAEDGDACTNDVCAGGRCTHPFELVDRATCADVQNVFRQALALEGEVRAILAVPASRSLTARVDAIGSGLDDVGRALAGKMRDPSADGRGVLDSPLLERARLALGLVRHVQSQVLSLRRTEPSVRAESASVIGSRVRALVRGVRALRRDLHRLLGVRGSFVR